MIEPDFKSPQQITYEERDKLMHFNTSAYWHCFYDTTTNRLYNEYCRLIKEDGKSYLVGIGLLSEDNKQIESFES